MPNQFGFSIDSEIIPQHKQFKVLLIGDTCKDVYVYGKCSRLSPEAPVPVLVETHKTYSEGMAWNVKNNLQSFGVEVYLMTSMEQPVKTRYVDVRSNQQIMRCDQNDQVSEFKYDLPKEKFDALVISDYDKGFLTEEKLFELTDWFDGPTFIDSKKTNLPKNCYLKLNEFESNKLDGDYPNLIVTRGSKGAEYKSRMYPGEQVNVFDVAGAGDTFLSRLVYFYLRLGKVEYAIPYANKAAAFAVQQRGTHVLTEEEVHELCD